MPSISSGGKQLAVVHWIEDARPGHQRWDYVGDGNGLPPERDDAIPVHESAEELTVRTALGLRAARSRAGSLLSLVLDLLGGGQWHRSAPFRCIAGKCSMVAEGLNPQRHIRTHVCGLNGHE